MEMRKCERGHYYDASVHGSCPYCNREEDAEKTMAMGVTLAGGSTVAQANGTITAAGTTMPGQVPLIRPMTTTGTDEGKTIAMFQTEQGVDPVVGWLICLDGKEKGRDYRIHSDNNFIGRSEKMDICIKSDDTISRENQAVLTYDAGERRYYFSPGDGRSIIRLNGKAIFQTTEFKAYD